MFSYIWPIALVVLSNVFYQICAKSIPNNLDPFASLSITYSIGAIISIVLYYTVSKGNNLFHEYTKINFAPFLLGIVIVGLEVGFIFAYKAGWAISTASIVQSAFLSVILLIVGTIIYHEQLSWNKIVGTIVCLIGLGLINLKF